MPDSKDKTSGRERVKKGQVKRGDRDAPVLDPTNPASKPYGTTSDQIANMEGEGQAQTPGQDPPAGIKEKAGQGRGKVERP